MKLSKIRLIILIAVLSLGSNSQAQLQLEIQSPATINVGYKTGRLTFMAGTDFYSYSNTTETTTIQRSIEYDFSKWEILPEIDIPMQGDSITVITSKSESSVFTMTPFLGCKYNFNDEQISPYILGGIGKQLPLSVSASNTQLENELADRYRELHIKLGFGIDFTLHKNLVLGAEFGGSFASSQYENEFGGSELSVIRMKIKEDTGYLRSYSRVTCAYLF